MKALDAARLAMFERTAALETTTDPGVFAKMPKFATYLAELKTITTRVNTALELQLAHPPISAVDKQIARDTLIDAMTEVSYAVIAHAADNNMAGVVEGFPDSESQFRKMSARKLIAEATNLLKRANEYETALTDFGITKTEITALEGATEKFIALEPIPKRNRLIRKGATNDIRDGIRLGIACVGNMDRLVKTVRKREPAFHTEYRNCRNIDKPARRIIPLRGTVTDSAGNPLKGVKITVDNRPDTAKTAPKGGFSVRHLPDGVYILRFNHPGYQELTHTAAIHNGTPNRIQLQLREI